MSTNHIEADIVNPYSFELLSYNLTSTSMKQRCHILDYEDWRCQVSNDSNGIEKKSGCSSTIDPFGSWSVTIRIRTTELFTGWRGDDDVRFTAKLVQNLHRMGGSYIPLESHRFGIVLGEREQGRRIYVHG